MQAARALFEQYVPPLHRQVIGFAMVGGFCLVLTIVLMWLMHDGLGIEENLSNLVVSVVVMIVTYILNRTLIFEPGRHKPLKEMIAFFTLSIIGLGLNLLLFYLGTKYTPINYLVVKVITVFLIAGFNFVTRKTFVFKN